MRRGYGTTHGLSMNKFLSLGQQPHHPPPGRFISSRGDGLRGWACRIRTKESVREPPNWICVTISSKVGASLRQRPVAYELRYTDLLRPIQQAILAGGGIILSPAASGRRPQFFSVAPCSSGLTTSLIVRPAHRPVRRPQRGSAAFGHHRLRLAVLRSSAGRLPNQISKPS
jgi:hypothetical protein